MSAWMRKCDQELDRPAADQNVGYSVVVGSVPLEPVLQWDEQLITHEDVMSGQVAKPNGSGSPSTTQS